MDKHGLEHLAEDQDKWWAFVNAVVNLWVSQNAGVFLELRRTD